ncbi:MAG TPA: OmpA family protein [Acidobacteriaceae bacterium]|jgi:outer membrane protein OmpA-like peptidoglycan-associated protein
MKAIVAAIALFCVSAFPSFAQDTSPVMQKTPPPTQEMRNGEPLYRVQVIGRNIPAINYFNRTGSTRIGFEGTSLLPGAKGRARVDNGKGNATIDAHFEGLPPANTFGPEYLTYVLWAITPDGRPSSLGEVLPDGKKAYVRLTTNMQAFGLIVTAEPYFTVTMPSDVVVMQNVVLHDKTAGVVTPIDAHYTLLPRGIYTRAAGGKVLHPITRNDRSPLDLYEAINAVQIAEAAGANQYAPDILARAKEQLSNAQDLDQRKRDRKQEVTFARAAVQTAEDARLVTLRKIQAEQRAAEQADQKARQDAANAAAEKSRLEAQQSQLAEQQAQLQAQREAQQRADAEAAAQRAQAAQQSAEQQAAAARAREAQLREQLRQQLNSILQTQETPRGLVVNLSDVLFATGRYDLKQDTQLKLARISGIFLAHPDLKVQVEGYTDNVGSQAYNQKLSEQRASTVQSFLISQGISPQNVSAIGYGMNNPVADNSTAAGRKQNRRVEMVVSGPSIGIPNQAAPGQTPAPAPAAAAPAPQPAPAQPAPPPAPANPSGVSNPPGPQG